MKKLLQILAGALLLIGISVSVASAHDGHVHCTITNTGPDSNNTCTVNNSTEVTITCSNGVSVTNSTIQTSSSGTATVSGNTISGNATSGDASNVNSLANELASYCLAAAPTPTDPEPESQTPQVQGESTTVVANLPATGSTSPLTIAIVIVVGALGLTIASKLAFATISRFQK